MPFGRWGSPTAMHHTIGGHYYLPNPTIQASIFNPSSQMFTTLLRSEIWLMLGGWEAGFGLCASKCAYLACSKRAGFFWVGCELEGLPIHPTHGTKMCLRMRLSGNRMSLILILQLDFQLPEGLFNLILIFLFRYLSILCSELYFQGIKSALE